MHCEACQDVFDNLLVAEPSAAEEAALAEHLEKCPDCARQYAQARQLVAALTVAGPFPASHASHNFKVRIMDALARAQVSRPMPTATEASRLGRWKIVAALAVAAVLLIALTPLLRAIRGPQGPSAFGLLAESCAAEEKQFAGNQIVHLVNEIVVMPVADPTLAQMRWRPLVSLDATGKPRFSQLTLPADVDKGYTVEDQSWYDPATGRFARVLTRDDKPIFANAFDGKNVYVEESPAAGPPRIVSQPIAEDFHAPKSPAEFLGMAAGLRSGLDLKRDEGLVSDVAKTTLDDGAEARIIKLSFPKSEGKEPIDSYWLVTIRSGSNTLEKEEWFAQGKSLLVIRRGKAKSGEEPGMGWDLAGLAKQFAAATAAGWPKILPDMVVLNVSVEHMVKKADFKTYVFSKAPSWTGDPEITDCLDIATPPHRMFITAYRAKDSRHVVMIQSFTYNAGLGPRVKQGKVIYTSPTGVKVWSGAKDQWLAEILLQSARYAIKDPPAKERTGYVLETPAGTFPALAINGKLSEEELHGLVDSLVLAE